MCSPSAFMKFIKSLILLGLYHVLTELTNELFITCYMSFNNLPQSKLASYNKVGKPEINIVKGHPTGFDT